MAGANPQRTSWTPEEVRGVLQPEWHRPLDPYIPANVQLVAAYDAIYVATARGLYALDAATGAKKWLYATEMPLGHSPTIDNGVAYVGGFDKKLHAIDAIAGPGPANAPLWTFTAGAGFDTNPLVVSNTVYLGNRDGFFYAIHAAGPLQGTLAWRYRTDGPILFSAAYKDGVVYFASNDSYAYALNAQTGALLWRKRLPTGNGFHSWWPVVAGNTVVFSVSRGYRLGTPPYATIQRETHYDPGVILPPVSGGLMNVSSILSYFSANPTRKVHYLLDAATGNEVATAPFLRQGTTSSGHPFPVAVHPNGAIYAANRYTDERGQVVGWQPGSSTITISRQGSNAFDEPLAWALGGNVVYWNLCCDREGGSFPISGGQDWNWFAYNLDTLIPGYDIKYMGHNEQLADLNKVYGGWNGVYGVHGHQNPPIPYKGRVYMHRSNAIIAFSATGGAQALPLWETVQVHDQPAGVDVAGLKQMLETEIQKIIAAGHLRPGYGVEGNFARTGTCEAGDRLTDYWSNPADTLLYLTRALPHLSPTLRQSLQTYLRSEFDRFVPNSAFSYTHIGWADGAAREAYDLPPEVQADLVENPASQWKACDFRGWPSPPYIGWPPHLFYALWQYAEAFGGAQAIFDQNRQLLGVPPSNATLAEAPHAHNAWIAGYLGYMQLERMAGYTSAIEQSAKYPEYQRLLNLRIQTFDKDNPWGPDANHPEQTMAIARNFMYMTPELGQYLHDHILSEIQAAFDEYERTAPYWFVTKFEATFNEAVMHHLYDYNAMFAAKALILQEPPEELARYLDVPAFARGDLFYINNLVTTLDASSTALSPLYRVNAPYFSGDVRFAETAVFWLGSVTPSENYADVRVGYNDHELYVHVNVIDRLLWYDDTPAGGVLTDWDSVSLYLNTDGNAGSTPGSNAYRFDGQLTWWESPRTPWQAAYRGNGSGWIAATVPFTTEANWRGDAPNNTGDDRGWFEFFHIPFASLGLAGPPPSGAVWRVGVAVHDRDAAGGPVDDSMWPPAMSALQPATWGQLSFGLPAHAQPATMDGARPAASGTTVIRHNLNGAIVPDVAAGGGTTCGEGLDFWTEWGQHNYGGLEYVNVQNQSDPADFPCFSKYFVTFPLDAVPAGKVVVSATLLLHHFGNSGIGWTPGPEPSFIQVFTVGENWNEQTLNWNNAPPARENITGAWVDPLLAYPGEPGVARTWDVSRAADEAYQAGQPLRLVLYSADWPMHSGRYFWSSDHEEWRSEARPSLLVMWQGQPVTPVVQIWLPVITRDP